MNFLILKRGGYNLGTVGSTGGEVSGAVYVARNPVAENEAANKNYTNNVFTSIPVTSFTTGNMPAARLPEFGGDLLKSVGVTETTLKMSPVTPDTYMKVVVNTKGIISNGFSLNETDLPDIPWSKITSGKPTTLGGYGITNALSTAGGVMTGVLQVESITTDLSCLANKRFVDNEGSSSAGVAVGGIVYKPTEVTPFGYLRCNGGVVNKSNYPNLYAAIGDNFSYNLEPGVGKPWIQQYAFNDYEFGNLNNWVTGPSLVGGRQGGQAAVIKNKLYYFGGASDSGSTMTVQMAEIQDDGSISPWEVLPNLPFYFYRGQIVVAKNHVYFLGDADASYVYYAPINEDGTLGAMVTSAPLPGPLSRSQAIVTKSRIYLIGGVSTGSIEVSTVYHAVINSDGTLGQWMTGNSLPNTYALSTCVVTKNRVYLLGGNRNSSVYSEIYSAIIDEEGVIGGWSSAGNMPVATYGASAIVTKKKIAYLTGNNAALEIRYAPINPDGTIGLWTTGINHFITGIMYCQFVIVKNRVYSLGGYDSSNYARAGVFYHTFEGGSNDYTNYYDGTFITTDNTTFKLPDVKERLLNMNAYIKY